MLERPPSSPRSRWQKAYRQRRRAAIKVYPVPLPDDVVETLFGWHWFDGLDLNNKAAIGRAIAREIAKATKGRE
jgi:hypothetical protein